MPKVKVKPRARPRPPLWRRLVIGVALMLVASIALMLFLLRQAPAFYRAELARAREGQQAASDQCLANLSATASQAQRPGVWRAEFTAQELNGWLAHDLPRNHPELLSEAGSSPRVALEDHRGKIAFEHRGFLTTYVSLEFDVEVRDERTFAIRFLALKGGAMPLPLGAVVEPLTSVAAQLDQPVQWTEEDGLPVALVTLTNWEAENVQIVLREVRIEAERLVLVGETQPVIVGKQFD